MIWPISGACNASPSGPLKWTDFGPTAGWRNTLLNNTSFVERLRDQGTSIPSILHFCPTMKFHGICIDSGHTIDAGVASHVVGNTIFEVTEQLPGSNQEVRMKLMRGLLKDWYDKHPDVRRLDGDLTYARLRSAADWPQLSAKMAATRHLVAFCLWLARTYRRHDEEHKVHDERRLAVCQLLQRYYDICNREDMFLSTDAKIEMKKLSSLFCIIYGKLSQEALDNRQRMWKCIPKFHLFQHILEFAFWNPRFTWTYQDEDYQRAVKEIALSCSTRTAAHMILYKWIVSRFRPPLVESS